MTTTTKKKPRKTTPKPGTVTIAVPIADELPPGYVTRHVDVQLNRSQAETLKRIQVELNSRAERLENERFVQSAGDVVRWVVERIIKCESNC